MSVFPIVNTKDADAVKALVKRTSAALYPGKSLLWLDRLFADMETFFNGGDPDFASVDLRYHDWEHTLQATVCLTLIIEGRERAGVIPRIDSRHYELAISAALLHDAGYIKLRSDVLGTGAKYTFCHVLRSCAFAATYLPTLGANDSEVEAVLAAINCTGPANELSRLNFRAPVDRIIGAALATADYLGQMAAVDYPDELEILFKEFEESDNYFAVPRSRRIYSSPHDLIIRTPDFWREFVRPKLETDFLALYRFLASPYPHGENAYIAAVENNILEIQRRGAMIPSAARAASPGTLAK